MIALASDMLHVSLFSFRMVGFGADESVRLQSDAIMKFGETAGTGEGAEGYGGGASQLRGHAYLHQDFG